MDHEGSQRAATRKAKDLLKPGQTDSGCTGQDDPVRAAVLIKHRPGPLLCD
jgi:hypothetical protein